MIKVLYFGSLREALDCSVESMPWSKGTVEDLLELLRSRGSEWQSALSDHNIFRVVVDQHIVDRKTPILDAAEVAILPPVTGG